ncbi:MAG: GntR family transcriptional regulator [Syntrophorhabdales bacterium]|jgi:DNA-binding GntR family transcriptional regulator
MEREEIVSILETEIANGNIRAGQRLVEIQLIDRFVVARSKIREVMRQLEMDGFVTIVRNTGAVVTEVTQKDVEHSYDLMGVLEGLSVREATPYLTFRHFEEMQKIIDDMEATENPVLLNQLNDDFHRLLCSLSDNVRLVQVAHNLRLHLKRFGSKAFINPYQIGVSRREHRSIITAIREGEPIKAEGLVRSHYITTKNCHIKSAVIRPPSHVIQETNDLKRTPI